MLGFRSFLASEKVKEHIPWSEKKKRHGHSVLNTSRFLNTWKCSFKVLS